MLKISLKQINRRKAITFLSSVLATHAIPKTVFSSEDSVNNRILNLSSGSAVDDARIYLEVPEIAENGNTVPVSVSAPGAKRVMLLADGNPRPNVATFNFSNLAVPDCSMRIRLAKSQNILAVAEMTDGSFTQVANAVKVTIGGCGG